jgi:Gas vesicle synthesis protein GvpL/GvpF
VFSPDTDADVASLYVHALADEPTRSWRANGRKIQSIAVGKIFAVGERRARAPELSESELRFQHAVVVHIAGRVPAVLPAQFGALVDDKALDSILRQRESTIREAMTLVRGRVQMTLRTVARVRQSTEENVGSASGRTGPVSGKQYLERRRGEASTQLPARVEKLVARAARCVAAERREATRAGTIAVYHLVEKSDVDAYREALDDLRGVTVSGPWPPFAFVPELWS